MSRDDYGNAESMVVNNHSRLQMVGRATLCIHYHSPPRSLVCVYIKFFQRHDIDYHNPDQSLMDQYFFIVADEIMPNEWQEMGINLGIPLEKVRAIGQHPEQDKSRLCFKVLKLWQSSPASSHHELIRVLRDNMRHRDLVKFIHQYVFLKQNKSHQGRGGGC